MGSTTGRFLGTLLALLLTPPSGWSAVPRCADKTGSISYQALPWEATARATSAETRREAARHLFWKATCGARTVYLLGSVHFGSADLYPLPAVIMEAYQRSDSLVVEADIGGATEKEEMQLVLRKGLYRNHKTLKDQISPATWKLLVRTSRQLGIPESRFIRQKPWLVSLVLAGMVVTEGGFSKDYGIDRFFLSRASSDPTKTVLELESIEQQLNLLDNLSQKAQEEMLIQTLRDIGKGPETFRTVVDAWKRGDARTIDEMTRKSFQEGKHGKELYQALILRRNIAMVEKLSRLMDEGKTFFVVVGAGHLVGPRGIVQLLRRKGYRVRQY